MKKSKLKTEPSSPIAETKIPLYITINDILAVIRADYHEGYNPTTPEEETDFANWWDKSCAPIFTKFLERGDGIAMYKNQAMDSKDYGRLVCMSFGSSAAQIESTTPPEKMPDTGQFSTPWAYTLVNTLILPKEKI